MLQNRRLSAIFSLLMLLVVVAGGGMDGFVLCVLPDGRASIEPASGLCCDDSAVYRADPYEYPATADASGDDGHHCDSCVDIPLSGPELIRQSSDDVSAKLRIVSVSSAPNFASGSRLAASDVSCSPPPSAKATFVSIRTVNLRI